MGADLPFCFIENEIFSEKVKNKHLILILAAL
jgi:hypothetical protein